MQGLASSPFQTGRTGTPPSLQPASSETTFGPTSGAQVDAPTLEDFTTQGVTTPLQTVGGVVIPTPKAPVAVDQPAQQFATPGVNPGSVERTQLALAATQNAIVTTTAGPASQRMSEIDCTPVMAAGKWVCDGFGDCVVGGCKVVGWLLSCPFETVKCLCQTCGNCLDGDY
jgi:hypothetical protein